MKPIDLAKEARESISEYCINTCKAKCCQRGYLLLMGEGEVDLIAGEEKEQLLKKEILIPNSNGFYYYDSSKKPCRNLDKNFMCSEHKNTNRPLVCRDYPVFLMQNKVMFGKTCLAAQEGLLDEYKKKFENMGFEVV